MEWSLEESERLALEEAVECNVRKIHLFAGGWSDVSLMRVHSALISLEMSPCRRRRPSEARVMASRRVGCQLEGPEAGMDPVSQVVNVVLAGEGGVVMSDFGYA